MPNIVNFFLDDPFRKKLWPEAAVSLKISGAAPVKNMVGSRIENY